MEQESFILVLFQFKIQNNFANDVVQLIEILGGEIKWGRKSAYRDVWKNVFSRLVYCKFPTSNCHINVRKFLQLSEPGLKTPWGHELLCTSWVRQLVL